MATHRATSGSDEGKDAFHAWSAKSAKYDPDVVDARWDHYERSPATEIGAAKIFALAAEAVPGWRKPSLSSRKDAIEEEDGGFVDFADEEETPVQWGVEGLFERQGVGGIFAAPSQGKTGVKNNLTVCYALGLPFMGREVSTPGIVLSYVLEDRHNAKHLLRMTCEGMGVDPARLNGRVFLNKRDAGLSLPADTSQVLNDISALETRTGEKVVAVFIDTIRETSPTGSMSDQKDVTPILASFKEIGRGRMVFVCGHVSVENSRLPLEERNPMGSGDFLARLDTVLHLETSIGKDQPEGAGRIWVQKVRNGPARYEIPLKVRRASSGLPVPLLDTSGEARPQTALPGRREHAKGDGKSKFAPSNPFEDERTVKTAVAVLEEEMHKAHRTSTLVELMMRKEHFSIEKKSLADKVIRLARAKSCPLHKMYRPALSTDQAWKYYDHSLAGGSPFTPAAAGIRSDRAERTNDCPPRPTHATSEGLTMP
jgi:AAA domain/Primase C terminal 2 (PriCT-2)